MYEKVDRDLFRIADRLVHINSSYRVFYNKRDERYEVHVSERPSFMSLAFIVPYPELDARVLDYAQKTRRQNADIIEAEISLGNAKIASEAKLRLDTAQTVLEDMLRYAARAGHSVDFSHNFLKEF